MDFREILLDRRIYWITMKFGELLDGAVFIHSKEVSDEYFLSSVRSAYQVFILFTCRLSEACVLQRVCVEVVVTQLDAVQH